MPLPGGPSDKAGNRYEAIWTVVCMSRVLDGRYDSIRLESPGPEGEGVEFWLRRDDSREHERIIDRLTIPFQNDVVSDYAGFESR